MRIQANTIGLLALGAATLAGCVTALTAQTRNEISIKMASAQSSLKVCYETALKRDENLGGRVTLAFVVAPDGQFTDVKVAGGTLPNEGVKQCVIQQVALLRVLAAPGRPVRVTYPLDFEAEPVP